VLVIGLRIKDAQTTIIVADISIVFAYYAGFASGDIDICGKISSVVLFEGSFDGIGGAGVFF
jgi:hypothetical protein